MTVAEPKIIRRQVHEGVLSGEYDYRQGCGVGFVGFVARYLSITYYRLMIL